MTHRAMSSRRGLALACGALRLACGALRLACGALRLACGALRLACGALLFGAAFSSHFAAAQSEQRNRAIDLNLLRPSASRHALFTTELASVAEPGEWLVGMVYNYQHRPLIVRSFGASLDDVVQGQHTANLLFSIGLPGRLELNVDMPVLLYMSGTGGRYLYPSLGGLDAQAFGDLRLTPKWNLFRKGGFGLALAATVNIPTGKMARFHGERSGIAPKVMFDFEKSAFAITAMLGYAVRNRAEFNGLVVGDEAMWALGIRIPILRQRVFGGEAERFSLIGEVYGRTNGNRFFGPMVENPIVALAAFRVSLLRNQLDLTAGVARGLHGGYGAPVFQPFVGATFATAGRDRDGDGVPDKFDRCPNRKGRISWQGCPDTDLDGIPDHEDKCPNEPGPRENQGCPWPDADGDGIADKDDKCPDKRGPRANKGCPWPDADGDGVPDKDDKCPSKAGPIRWQGCPDTDKDGIPDHEDKCPEQAGPAENDGCPVPGEKPAADAKTIPTPAAPPAVPEGPAKEPPKVEPAADIAKPAETPKDAPAADAAKPDAPAAAKPAESEAAAPAAGVGFSEQVVILPRVRFRTDSAKLTREATLALGTFVDWLKRFPKVTVRVEGHADRVGDKIYNVKLSQRRATAVRRYLIARGADKSNIEAAWLGDERPASENDEDTNRRVDIAITGGLPEGWRTRNAK